MFVSYLLICEMCDAGHGATSTSISSSTSTGRTTSTATVSPAHVGYQGSRRSANRGHATYRGRGSRFPAVWSTPTFQYLQFGTVPLLITFVQLCQLEAVVIGTQG